MATHDPTTRRAFLHGLTTLPLIGGGVVLAVASQGESEHERLLSRYRACVAEFRAKADFLGDEESAAFADAWWGVVREALETPVRSARDLRAQFKLVQEANEGCDFDPDSEEMQALYASIETLVRMEARHV